MLPLQQSEPRSPEQYGRTIGDALAFLDQSDVVLISTRVTLDWPAVYLPIAPDAVRPALQSLPASQSLPSEWGAGSRRELTLGSVAAITRAMEVG